MSDRDVNMTPLDPSKAASFAWADAGPARKVMDALEATKPGGSRFVGGCVRDSLLEKTPKDIDIATILTPDEVSDALHAADLGAAPTGIEHGTITGIADHNGVEITTLRADVSTDGRRATVAFTKDWATDAARRDFTVNAIYLTTDKLLFDPVGGVDDAAAGRVRFIGNAQDRIREDYLRILRFFRFSARFADSFDVNGLAACASLKEGMESLSAERIGDELTKILALENAATAIVAMEKTGILHQVWPAKANSERLARLKSVDLDAPAQLGLAALFGDNDRNENGKTIDMALRLSKAQADRRKLALKNARSVSSEMTENDARALLYRFGADAWRDAVLLTAAQQGGAVNQWQALRALPDRWSPPTFPIGGKDVLALGVEKGPEVAKILNAVETRWIEEGFPDAARAHEILAAVVG